MTRRTPIVLVCSIVLSFLVGHHTVSAIDVVQVRPLLYREKLDNGETKRGLIDLSNGSNEASEFDMSVRLFRQVGDDGSLEFYDDPDISRGIQVEVSNVELKAKEAVRIGFSVDGSKLPQGDIFAAILATAEHESAPQAIVSVAQIGTLLILQNGVPGERKASIAALDIDPLQIGDAVRGAVSVTNPANSTRMTGFFPSMQITIQPLGMTTKFEGPLIYAGRTRTFDFSVPSSQFGVYKIIVAANGESASRYVFLMTGVWKIVAPLGIATLLVLGGALYLYLQVSKRKHALHPR